MPLDRWMASAPISSISRSIWRLSLMPRPPSEFSWAENRMIFAEETHPVVIGPAVFINPVVAVRRQEFMDQIPVGCVDLHSVKTGLPGI